MGSSSATPFGYRRINLIDGQVVYPDEKFYQRVYERYIPEMIQRNEIPYNRRRFRPFEGDCDSDCEICNSNYSSRCGPDCRICNRYDNGCSDSEDFDSRYGPERYTPSRRNLNRANVYKFSHSTSFPNGLF